MNETDRNNLVTIISVILTMCYVGYIICPSIWLVLPPTIIGYIYGVYQILNSFVTDNLDKRMSGVKTLVGAAVLLSIVYALRDLGEWAGILTNSI